MVRMAPYGQELSARWLVPKLRAHMKRARRDFLPDDLTSAMSQQSVRACHSNRAGTTQVVARVCRKFAASSAYLPRPATKTICRAFRNEQARADKLLELPLESPTGHSLAQAFEFLDVVMKQKSRLQMDAGA